MVTIRWNKKEERALVVSHDGKDHYVVGAFVDSRYDDDRERRREKGDWRTDWSAYYCDYMYPVERIISFFSISAKYLPMNNIQKENWMREAHQYNQQNFFFSLNNIISKCSIFFP